MKTELQALAFFKTQALIDGSWVDASMSDRFPVFNPSDGGLIADVANCGASEAKEAIKAAENAQPSWRSKPAKERAAILRRWHDLIIKNIEGLAHLLTVEQGKPLPEARAEIAYGASYVEWFAEEAKRIYGDTIPQPSDDRRGVCIKQPVGVVACITPWNFPNAMLARKIAPALAAGCTVVCKPANETPLSANALGELALHAGVPRGVINILCGKTVEIGRELTAHPFVRKLTFTGSTAIGKKLVADCASTMKRTSMELGGNAPFIVFDDADVEAAVAGVMASKFRNAGQTCVCANRILVQDRIFDEFAEKLAAAVERLNVGDGFENDVQIGPLINEKAANDVFDLVEDAVSRGAEVLVGGGRSNLGPCFMSPTVLTKTDASMRVFQEEIFGPVAPLYRFESEEEAISLANDTPFGLASYFYARDIGRIWRVGEALEYGMVGVNEGAISNEMAPFGGVKESGHGREGSKYGLDDYLEIKYLCMGGLYQ